MEGSNVFVEVDREEVKVADACVNPTAIELNDVMKVSGRLGCDRSNLLVTSCVTRDEEDRNAAQLTHVNLLAVGTECKTKQPRIETVADLIFIINTLLSIQIKRVLGGKAGMFSVEFGEAKIGWAHIGHAAPFRI